MVHWLLNRLLAVPLLVKVVGAVALVALLFGTAVNLSARYSLAGEMSRLTEQATRARAAAFTARAERLLITGNRIGLRDLVRHELHGPDSLRYIVVYDSRRRVVAHSFRRAPPRSLSASLPRARIVRPQLRTLRSGDEIIFEALVPVVQGDAGFVQMGVGSRPITKRIDQMIDRLWLVLGGSLVIGLLLIIPLAHAISSPLKRLVHATDELRRGKLSCRAPVAPLDEVGELTVAFNRMADEQQQQRRELDESEAERQDLLDAIMHSQEEERRRISHDLHDEIGGSLSALLLDLRRRNEQCDSSGEHLEDWISIEQQVGGLIERVRHLAWTLLPSALDDIGLCAALEQQTVHLQRHSDMSIDFCGSVASCGECRCAPDVKLALYRVAQEAMTNSLRHSGASHLSVVVSSVDQVVSVVVEDNGCGFDTGAKRTDRPHLGLIGMRERIGAVGGTVTIESGDGSGTLVRASAPLWPTGCDPVRLEVRSPGEKSSSVTPASRRSRGAPGSEVHDGETEGTASR